MFTFYHIFFYLFIISFIFLGNNKKQRVWFWLCVWLLILLSGIRDITNFSDMPNYLSLYKTGEVEDVGLETSVNPGYSFLSKLFFEFGFSFQFFLFVVGAIIMGGYAWFIEKYSPNYLLAFAIFILVNYVMSIVAIRQFLACAAGMLAFDAAIRRKLVPNLIFVAIAISFHTTAVVLLPIYFLFGVKINKVSILILLGGLVLLTIGINMIASYISVISAYYANYLEMDIESSLPRTLMKIFICGLYIFALGRQIIEKDIRFLVLVCLVLGVVLYVGGSQIYGMFRLRSYFEIGEIIGIPLIWQTTKRYKRTKRLILRVGVIFYVVLLFVSFTSVLESNSIVLDSSVYKTIFG